VTEPPKWWADCVGYQVYVPSFQDSNGDGWGDLPGVTSRLDYLTDLGVTIIWLSPIHPSPFADHGYDVSDYRAVNPHFGTLQDLEGLLDKADDRGLRVLMDLAPDTPLTSTSGSARTAALRTGISTFGEVRAQEVGRRTTGSVASAARRGRGRKRRGSTTCTCSPARSPTSIGATQRWPMSSARSCRDGWTSASPVSGLMCLTLS
jgi:Alpha amylase, catalytic domain